MTLIGVPIAAVLALTGCGAGDGGTSDGGDGAGAGNALLTLGSLQEPTSWDPAQANEGHLAPIYQAVYDTLVKAEPDGELVPMLAEDSRWSSR
jgi:peptide/nickel transport system substrate-binding protein